MKAYKIEFIDRVADESSMMKQAVRTTHEYKFLCDLFFIMML